MPGHIRSPPTGNRDPLPSTAQGLIPRQQRPCIADKFLGCSVVVPFLARLSASDMNTACV